MITSAMRPELLEIDNLLDEVLHARKRISDVNLSVGKPPQMEADGRLLPMLGRPPLTADDTMRMARVFLGDSGRLVSQLEENGSCDCAYGMASGARFRVNIFKAAGNIGVVLRVLPTDIPSFESLNMPPIIKELTALTNGLVLVTGATGSGKSTTLASVIDQINKTKSVHIVTLEDPIEFRHEHKCATVNQRELGKDFTTFADGLRAALRQAPKIILVGEIRDRDTIEIALKAAETGHLVLSTMHTIDAGQTINRVVGMFESGEQRVIRVRLADMLRMVVSQRLLPRERGGRIAAVEVMGNNLPVREMIEQGETPERTFYDLIRDGNRIGWQTFDQHIARIYKDRIVTEDVAFAYCSDKSALRHTIDEIKTERGEDTSDLGDLEMAKPTRRK